MKLLIVSHTPHYQEGSKIKGWGPTIRELDHLASLFDEVVHLAPLHSGPVPGSSLSYSSENIRFHPVPPAGGNHLRDKLSIAFVLPAYLSAIRAELRSADVVHVRCPANISLAALALLCLFPHPAYRWVKYAGNWKPEGKEALSYTLQRGILRCGLHHGVVTVNGRWTGQPAHVHPFNNPSLTVDELAEARRAAVNKPDFSLVRCLFVGRLEEAKGVGVALRTIKMLNNQGIFAMLQLAGDGPNRAEYEKFVQENGLNQNVQFLGWVPKPDLNQIYAQAHFVLLPSASEGWPKVLSEGMAFGAVPVASSVSSVPQILSETKAGKAVEMATPQAFADTVLRYVKEKNAWQAASSAGQEAAARFTYSYYLEQVRLLFRQSWGLELKGGR